MKTPHKYTILLALIVLPAALCVRKWRVSQFDQQEQRLINTRPTIIFHSPREYHEVHVPFDREKGWIAVKASFSGKVADCFVDTGMGRVIWPKSLSLPSEGGGVSYSAYTPYYSARPCPAEWRVLPELSLGGYELKNCPSLSYEANTDEPATFHLPCILGYPVLAQTVLTIDYHKQELIFRDKDYDITRRPASPQSYLLSLLPISVGSQSYRTAPVVAGTIAGRPVHLLIDTGLAAGGIGLSNAAIIAKTEAATANRLLTNNRTNGKAIPDTDWSIGGLFDQTPIDILPGFTQGDVDGVIGYEVLRNYRITLDYRRQKVLLEWNPILEDVQDSIESRQAGVRQSPKDPFVHIELGKAYLFASRYQNAKQEFAAALSLDASNPFTHFKLGQCCYDLRDYPSASHEFDAAIALKPSEAFFYLWQGMALSKQGKLPSAHMAWQKAAALDKTAGVAQEAERLMSK